MAEERFVRQKERQSGVCKAGDCSTQYLHEVVLHRLILDLNLLDWS